MHRIGRVTRDEVRPIKVHFDNSLIAKYILRHQLKLRSLDNYENISFADDKTIEQRHHSVELRQTLKKRISKRESNLTMKYTEGVPAILESSNNDIATCSIKFKYHETHKCQQ
ncbi:hypothetical protein JTB14_016154 [Gonioctena quinquepunctata]|nr:hypothetical protein JTB14_016154 [Gonioctena quinquepunctata]